MQKIGVLGSGTVGTVLANGFLEHGHEVMRGTREPGKLVDWQQKVGAKARTGTFAEAARWHAPIKEEGAPPAPGVPWPRGCGRRVAPTATTPRSFSRRAAAARSG